MVFFCVLRDYTWRVLQNSKLFGGFLYSPAFCTNLFNNKLIDVRLNKLTLKKDLSLFRGTLHNNHYSTSPAPALTGKGKGGDKLDPRWVTGFVDAEGCFSIIIDISEPLK